MFRRVAGFAGGLRQKRSLMQAPQGIRTIHDGTPSGDDIGYTPSWRLPAGIVCWTLSFYLKDRRESRENLEKLKGKHMLILKGEREVYEKKIADLKEKLEARSDVRHNRARPNH